MKILESCGEGYDFSPDSISDKIRDAQFVI